MNDIFIKVREASRKFAAFACEEIINSVLLSLADTLESSSDAILQAVVFGVTAIHSCKVSTVGLQYSIRRGFEGVG